MNNVITDGGVNVVVDNDVGVGVGVAIDDSKGLLGGNPANVGLWSQIAAHPAGLPDINWKNRGNIQMLLCKSYSLS